MTRAVVLDLEANGLLSDATRVWCGVVKDLHTKEVLTFPPSKIEHLLKFLDTCDIIVTHGGTAYDWPLLYKLYGYTYEGRKIDTLLISRLQRHSRTLPVHCGNRRAGPHSVEAWGWRVGMGKVEVAVEEWETYSPIILERCTVDVEIQHKILTALQNEAEGEGWGRAIKATGQLFANLQQQAEYGWTVDVPHLDRSIVQLTKWIDKIDEKTESYLPFLCEPKEHKVKGVYGYVKKPFKKDGTLSAASERSVSTGMCSGAISGPFSRVEFRKVDVSLGQEIKKFLLDQGWQPAAYNYNDKGEQTSPKLNKEDPFTGVQGALGRLVVRRVQCRHWRSVLEGWRGTVREDGRMPSVVTGLTVTARARHRGLVNVPRPSSFFGSQIRSCFVSKEGWVLVGADAVSCQMRMLCERMGDPAYTKAVLADDHHEVNRVAAGLETRDQAKTFFYALIFGAGDNKIGSIAGGNQAAGKRLKQKFFSQLPKMKGTVDRLCEEWRSHAQPRKRPDLYPGAIEYRSGWIKGLDGRRISCDSEHKVLCSALQSDEAIMMTHAYNDICEVLGKRYRYGEDYGVLCWYHDEVQVECKPELAEDVGEIMSSSIAAAAVQLGLKVPQAGTYKIGNNWSETH